MVPTGSTDGLDLDHALASARSCCVRAHAPGLEQTDDYHRRPCKLCVNWMPEYSDCRSPYSDMHMGPITGLAVILDQNQS